MFEFLITRPMGWIIEQIYNLVSNYGLAIILFTVVIKLILMPLNVKSQKSMKKQQKIQPYLAELQEKYANDQEKLQREMMKLYKDNNVSMMGGCLPLLIQMPILIGLYSVIRRPITYLAGVTLDQFRDNPDIIAKVEEIVKAMGDKVGNVANMTVEQIGHNAQIQLAKWAEIVHGPAHEWAVNFNFLGLDLSNNPSAALSSLMRMDFSNWGVIALLIIPILAVIGSIAQTKITQMQSGQNNQANDSANSMAKSMNMMMPLMTAFFTLTLPAGLGIYWIISSIVQIIQQIALNYYFDKKGEDIVVTIPEKKQLHGAKRKKRK